MKPYFIMTVDVDPPVSTIPRFIIRDGLIFLLKLFDEYAIKATFFVPAVVTEQFPANVEEIARRGHEVACHGLKHGIWEATLNVDEQIRMIRTATEIIQSATGSRPVGFRAPLFKINRNCWTALQKNGYVYDSSVVCSPFYGGHRIFLPTKPYILPVPKTNGNRGLLEIPVSANPFLPFPLGGAWMRIFGSRWSKIGVKLNFMSKTPAVFYIHPKDVIARTYGRVWYYYRNTANCAKMLDEIIEYAKRNGAKFLTAYELARLSEAEYLKTC
jgi:peptidoglycan/xylan/chitin deacetylase (PgdA/CDA1 family)